MVNGKQKGASFERATCVKLSLWVSNGEQEDLYWRSAGSGSRSTVAFKRGKRLAAQAGDITCIHPRGEPFTNKFFCECKHYRDLNFQGLLAGKGHLAEFWSEAKEQSNRYTKLPLMIAKQNRLPTVICLSTEGMLTLKVSPKATLLTAPPLDLYILDADEFFKVPASVFIDR